MGASAAVLVVVAMFAAGCSSAGTAPSSAAPGAAREVLVSPTPVTGMDGRPPFDAGASPTARPPGWVGGTTGPGPSGPPAAIVPDVRGMVFEQAVRRLWEAGIDFGLVVARGSDETLWSVLQQNPPPGSDTPDSGAIDLVLSMRAIEGSTETQLRQCDPTAAHLADPYCLGKRLQYFD